MSIKAWPHKKKTTLAVLLATVLVLCIACVVFFLQSQDHALFHFKPSSVESITLWCGDGGSMEITDREQINQAIQLLNDFTYEETEKIPPACGWSYCLDFSVGVKYVSIEFGESYIRGRGEDGGSTVYYGPTGHFQTLVDLGEDAHAKFLKDND